MPTFSPQEIYLTEDGQTDIVFIHPHIVGSGDIMVFLNGMLCVRNEDYREIDEYTIRFSYQLSANDAVIIQHQIYFDDKKITVISDSSISLFQRYGDEQTLFPTQKYTLTFKHGTQVFTSSFHTVIDPLYSTVQTIKNDLGEIVSDIPDERILYLIFQNSILSQNIASEENLALLESEVKIPYVFKQFVRYRTEMDIIIAIYMLITGRQGSVTKTLGELKIDRRYTWGTTIIEPILADLKEKLKEWEKLLRGSSGFVSPVATAVRAGASSPYPLTSPRRGSGGGNAN